MIRETKKKPIASFSFSPLSFRTLQGSVSMLNIKIHDSTVRKRLNKYELFGRVARRKPLLGKNKHGSTNYVCKVVFEQVTKLLEQCPLDRLDQSGDVCL